MSAEFIRVSARVRPSASCSSSREVLSLDKTNVAIIASNNKLYHFDHIFDKNADQAMVFKVVGQRIIDGALEGINGTIFAYGQTGSGKTHTMLGPAQEDRCFDDVHQKGLMPRCFKYLFEQLEQTRSKKGATYEYSVSCVFVELYNEAITDLLDDSCPAVTIRAEAKNIMLQGATCENVSTFHEAMRLLRSGWHNRRVGETAMNKESSRSHAVLTIDVVQTEEEACVINKREARINLVDLAGSERQSQTGATGVRLKEAAKINQSLGTLGRVIRELSSKSKVAHVPYRDSKLTLMIRDSLGGSSRTAVIVCVHPDEDYYAESLSTLKFAEDCRLVKNELHVNREVTGKSVDALQAKVLELELQLENAEKQTIQQYEGRLKTIEGERDSFKQRLRDLENKEIDDTIALYEPSTLSHALRTPAQKQRRRTRFNTPAQKIHLDATRAAQIPFWGDEDDKENETKDIPQLLNFLRTKQEEIKTLQSEKDELESLANDRLRTIEELESERNTLGTDKSNLENALMTEQELVQKLLKSCDELKTDIEYKTSEITVLNDKLNKHSTKLKELSRCLSQKDVLLQDKDTENKELESIALRKAAKYEQNKSHLADSAKEILRLNNLLAEQIKQLTEKEHHMKLIQDENRRLLRSEAERITLKHTVDEQKTLLESAEQQVFDLECKIVDLDDKINGKATEIDMLKITISDRDEQIAGLNREVAALNAVVVEQHGHTNSNQRINVMGRYRDQAHQQRIENERLRSDNDRLKRENAKLRASQTSS